MKSFPLFILFIFFLNSCSKEDPQDCSKMTQCTRTFANYSDCTPNDMAWDTVYWVTTISEPMSVCDTTNWKDDMERAQFENYLAGDADWKRFLDTYPTKCNCSPN